MRDWREQLQALKDRANRKTAENDAGSSRLVSTTPSILNVNLGIDFGTSFTKVVYRDVGTEASGVATFKSGGLAGALIRSSVNLYPNGEVRLGASNRSDGAFALRYLKMRLANSDLPGFALPNELAAHLSGTGLRSLAAFFLSEVISEAKRTIVQLEADRVARRPVVWSGNVGVPVEYYDSPTLQVFQEVLSVAWAWAEAHEAMGTLKDLRQRYEECAARLNPGTSKCQAVPEIAAAVQSFVTSRQAPNGIYVYFDIGGGTVDGVAFDYSNRQGRRHIDFYSGKVEPFGISTFAQRIGNDLSAIVEEVIAEPNAPLAVRLPLDDRARELRQLVGLVVMTAKRKDPRNWQREAVQGVARLPNIAALLTMRTSLPLIVFVGGGGASSAWYRDTIVSTHTIHRQINAGIPPYRLAVVPKPTELAMNGIEEEHFHRFAIAYGLSLPYGEGPEIRLPSQFSKADPLPLRIASGAVPYEDSKDVLD